jgi:DNA replication initiation complex subunit (GINS family)
MGADIIITYETLYDLLRREKNRSEIQELPEDYLNNLINYLRKKKEILESQEKKKSIFTTVEVQKTRRQIESIQKIIKELYERRESKIIKSSLISSRTHIDTEEKNNMLPEEEELYQELTGKLNYFRENVLYQLSNGDAPKIILKNPKPKDLKKPEKPNKTAKKIRLLCDMPKFLGTDLETYGPYKENSTTEMPDEVANLLIKQQRAEEI